MRNSIIPTFIALTLGMTTSLSADDAKWSYSGETGPEHWANLSSDYATCGKGKNQSPINIDSKTTLAAQNRSIKFNYGLLTAETIKNTGNYLQVDVSAGANIVVDGAQFDLKYLKVHMPSENTYNNEHFDMEVQFVHEGANQQVTYVSMMSDVGLADRTLDKLLDQAPMEVGELTTPAANTLRHMEMKKRLANYYRYNGSMTTPPCTEGVRWFILKSAGTFSQEQQQKFKNVIKHPNNRPIQALNARIVTK